MYDQVDGYDCYARIMSIDGFREYAVVNNNGTHWLVLDRPLVSVGGNDYAWVKVASFPYGPTDEDSTHVHEIAMDFAVHMAKRR